MADAKGFMKKVLVPVDGSDSSLLAEETAAIVAKKMGATVTVLHVIREAEEYYRWLYAAQGLEKGIAKCSVLVFPAKHDSIKIAEKL